MSVWSPPRTDGRAVPFAVAVPVGAAAVAGVCLLAGALPDADAARLWLPALAVGGIAYAARDVRAGAALAVIAFLLVDGFLENRSGVLSWHAGDGSRLGLLLLCAVLGAAFAALPAAVEHGRERAGRRRPHRQVAVVEERTDTGSAPGGGEEVR